MGLKETLGSDPELAPLAEKFADEKALAKAWKEADKLINSTQRAPREDAPVEDWQKFWGKLGRPENPDGYELPDGDPLRALAPVAHETGLTKKQMKALAEANAAAQAQAQAARDKAFQEQRARNEAALKAKLGDRFETTQAALDDWMKKTFGEDRAGVYKDLGLDTHPEMQAILAAAAMAAGNDIIPHAMGGKLDPTSGLAEKARKWVELQSAEPIMKGRQHPLYEETVAEMTRLAGEIYDSGHTGSITDLLKPSERIVKMPPKNQKTPT